MEELGGANIFLYRRILPANDGYRRGKAETLNATNPWGANMCVAPEWKIWEGRVFSEIGEYYPGTTDIDVGRPKLSTQPTQGVPTCA